MTRHGRPRSRPLLPPNADSIKVRLPPAPSGPQAEPPEGPSALRPTWSATTPPSAVPARLVDLSDACHEKCPVLQIFYPLSLFLIFSSMRPDHGPCPHRALKNPQPHPTRWGPCLLFPVAGGHDEHDPGRVARVPDDGRCPRYPSRIGILIPGSTSKTARRESSR